MKKLVVVVVFVVGGLVLFNYARTGELGVIPATSLTAEEQQLRELSDRLDDAGKLLAQAHRQAAMSGIDTSSDVEAVRLEGMTIRRELRALRKNLTEPKAERQAEELSDRLDELIEQF